MDFYGFEDIKVNVAREGPQMLWRLKICLFRQVINDELWKDYL